VRVDPQTVIENSPIKSKSEGILTIVPIDTSGQVFGPGYSDRIDILPEVGVRNGPIYDNGDGFYFQIIKSRGGEEEGVITVKVDGVEMKAKPYIRFERDIWCKCVDVGPGIAIPVGGLADNYEVGRNIMISSGHYFTPQFSLIGSLGLSVFNPRSVEPGVDELRCGNISLNLKYRNHIKDIIYGHVRGGIGYYVTSDLNVTGKSENGLGGNVGLGLDAQLCERYSISGGIGYHTMFDHDIDFFLLYIGNVFQF
jgi:hypothetical protein